MEHGSPGMLFCSWFQFVQTLGILVAYVYNYACAPPVNYLASSLTACACLPCMIQLPHHAGYLYARGRAVGLQLSPSVSNRLRHLGSRTHLGASLHQIQSTLTCQLVLPSQFRASDRH